MVKNGDRIGLTFGRDYGIISFEIAEGSQTYFRNQDDVEDMSVGGGAMQFDSIHIPFVFSIAVAVQTTQAGKFLLRLPIIEISVRGNIFNNSTFQYLVLKIYFYR